MSLIPEFKETQLEKEKVNWFGVQLERETFESLCARKADILDFALNGFIEIKEAK